MICDIAAFRSNLEFVLAVGLAPGEMVASTGGLLWE